jgi:hypothetical protein
MVQMRNEQTRFPKGIFGGDRDDDSLQEKAGITPVNRYLRPRYTESESEGDGNDNDDMRRRR